MIQIDMPMPDNCMECRFNTSEFGYCNAMPVEFVGQVSDFEEDGKPEWCPLKAQEPRTETQGRWERVGTDGIVCCSVCGMPMNKNRVCFPNGDSRYYYIATKYCHHCGAKNEKGDCDG